jgi:hypothetical protein
MKEKGERRKEKGERRKEKGERRKEKGDSNSGRKNVKMEILGNKTDK